MLETRVDLSNVQRHNFWRQMDRSGSQKCGSVGQNICHERRQVPGESTGRGRGAALLESGQDDRRPAQPRRTTGHRAQDRPQPCCARRQDTPLALREPQLAKTGGLGWYLQSSQRAHPRRLSLFGSHKRKIHVKAKHQTNSRERTRQAAYSTSYVSVTAPQRARSPRSRMLHTVRACAWRRAAHSRPALPTAAHPKH